MSDVLLAIMDDVVAGTVTRLQGGALRFDYDDDYRERVGATPLSVSLPLQVRSHPNGVVAPWLAGLLPDDEAVRRRWGREFHVSASSPFSLLSSPVGEDCAGAIRFATPDALDRVIGRQGDVQWLSDDDVAKRLRDLQDDATSWLGRTFTGQFSLAGAQAKTALLFQDDRWGVPSGATPTTHILKPAISGLDDHDLNEHLCLDAARRAGLLVARTRIARFAYETAVVVARYDRFERPSGEIERIHQEDLCQALGVPPDRKYQNEGGPGVSQIARLLRSVMPSAAAEEAIWRFADALIWNWLIGGTDAHAKNYSLLLSGNQVRLAPLYDIASALPYDTHERKLSYAMKIGGDYRVFLHRNPWSRAARELGLDPEELVERVGELAAAVPVAFAAAVEVPDVVALGRELPERLRRLVNERAARCRALLASPTSTIEPAA